MSRALTQESTLVADSDIVKVLAAAGRPYAEELASKYGIRDKFAPDFFKPSKDLDERFPIDFEPLAWLALFGGGGTYLVRRIRRGKDKKQY